jgi:hypothetical protein
MYTSTLLWPWHIQNLRRDAVCSQFFRQLNAVFSLGNCMCERRQSLIGWAFQDRCLCRVWVMRGTRLVRLSSVTIVCVGCVWTLHLPAPSKWLWFAMWGFTVFTLHHKYWHVVSSYLRDWACPPVQQSTRLNSSARSITQLRSHSLPCLSINYGNQRINQ